MDLKNPLVSCSSFFLLQLFTLYLSSFLAQAARAPPPLPPTKQYYHVVNVTSLMPKSYCESHIKARLVHGMNLEGIGTLFHIDWRSKEWSLEAPIKEASRLHNFNCNAHPLGSGFGSEKIRMASRNGPCSPLDNPPPKKISSTEQSFQTENANSNSDGSSAGYLEYTVTIGVGTPKAVFNMLVDTGSDNTWVLCKPCNKATGCAQNAHIFDPSKSSTFVKGSHHFRSYYGDNSNVSGLWGYDTLTVDKSLVVKKFQLGCGQNIHNSIFKDGAAGILGLGQGKGSLPYQGGSMFKTFSYCFPTTDSQVGYLVFGEEAHKKSFSSKPQLTPLLPPSKKLPTNYQGFSKSFYFVELIGIIVAGKQLNVDPSVFASPGTIIDSGTSITQLPPKAYSALAAAFNQSMASKYPPAQSKQKELDTCYNVDGFNRSEQVSVPDVTLRFGGGVDVSLRPSGIIIIPPEETNLVCLGFTQTQPDDDLTIIGNHQQRQIGMFFDLQGKRVGFGTTNCAH